MFILSSLILEGPDSSIAEYEPYNVHNSPRKSRIVTHCQDHLILYVNALLQDPSLY